MRTVPTTLSRIVLVPLVLAAIAVGLGGPAHAAGQATPAFGASEREAGAADSRIGRIEWQVTDDLALYGYLDHPRQTLHLFLERDHEQVWRGTQVGSGDLVGEFQDGRIQASIDWDRGRLVIVIGYRGDRYENRWTW
ncbi:hypothetical protein ACWEFJ_30910 [Actinosynnema sp. NPDC004786]